MPSINMRSPKTNRSLLLVACSILLMSCGHPDSQITDASTYYPSNILDYTGEITNASIRQLAYSDLGAWFAYGIPSAMEDRGGFTGPFLMTQENGVWSSKMLSKLTLVDKKTNNPIDWNRFKLTLNSYNSHLELEYIDEVLKINQSLFFTSQHSVVITTQVKNTSSGTITLSPSWTGALFPDVAKIERADDVIQLISEKSEAVGSIMTYGSNVENISHTDSSYIITLDQLKLKPGVSKELVVTHTFIFPEYDLDQELLHLEKVAINPQQYLNNRKVQLSEQLESLYERMDTTWTDSIYQNLLAKTVLTLQNNWRAPAGELTSSGLFPSYHYFWFHGYWAWDSWKHAVALAQYDTDLAAEQIHAMYDYMTDDGFIPDCLFRDTTIENHNYRNTKPPLSAWALWKVYKQNSDTTMLQSLYPKILQQHRWWYINRDHDQDGLCEFGSTDGTLKAAKWESGMDNAVRFDDSDILKNSEGAYSLNQESVDLNAYLYAEKIYLLDIAKVLDLTSDILIFESEATQLKTKIQEQFFDSETGWFYDTSIDGSSFIKVMGCEGWVPLWAEVATPEQATAVRENMMNPDYFNTAVPLPTLSANHSSFKPDRGYWRGPIWVDQAYFGIRGLHHYGYEQEAYDLTYKLMHNADGVLDKGPAIRENYHPLTGAGMESENFSWSAAHYMLLLLNE